MGLVTVNKENINHLKYHFGAHDMKMMPNMKCSFISEFILLTFNHRVLFSSYIKLEAKNTAFSE